MAVVGGAGGSLVSLAAQKGADLLLTGDVSHHHALEAESLGMTLIDGGHFQTEKAAFRIFAGRLKEMFISNGWEVLVEVFEDESDPVYDG
jgi:putative NIF3 family GTP cyclohydrolase 1 type 2